MKKLSMHLKRLVERKLVLAGLWTEVCILCPANQTYKRDMKFTLLPMRVVAQVKLHSLLIYIVF
jgi:nicotinamidase-related amidase